MMEEAISSDTSVIMSAKGITSEDLNLHQYFCDKLKAC
jgi:hypothetical protein